MFLIYLAFIYGGFKRPSIHSYPSVSFAFLKMFFLCKTPAAARDRNTFSPELSGNNILFCVTHRDVDHSNVLASCWVE